MNSSSTSELSNSQINAAIADITNSVIAALSAHGLIFQGNSTSDRQQPTQAHITEPSSSTSSAVTTTLNNITPSQSISDRDNYTDPIFSQALFTNNGALNAVNSLVAPPLNNGVWQTLY
jgi:hypothetical protein